MSAVDDAIDALRQAMLDEGQDPDTVEAKLHMAKPSETNIVGNYADLQRMGAIAQTGVLPTPPGQEDIETDDITEAFVAVETPADEQAAADADTDSMTKADMQAELEARGVDYPASATKAELQALLG
jgi:hypothetical protein